MHTKNTIHAKNGFTVIFISQKHMSEHIGNIKKTKSKH